MSALPRTNPLMAQAASQGSAPPPGQDPATELARLERRLRTNPTDIDSLLRAGKLMQGAGRSEEASTLLTKAAALAPERPETTVALADFLRANALHDEAVDLLQQAIEKNPKVPALWQAAAQAVAELADLDKAVTFFDEALRLDPNFHPCRLERAALHQRRGALAEALADYDALRKIAPNDPGVLAGWGDVKTAMGDRGAARIAYTAALGFARDQAPIADRLQRLAIMEFSRALPRAELPPAQAAADAAARPDRLDIVFFHVDLPGATASPFEKPDYRMMLVQAAAIARQRAPGARIVLLTDERTDPPAELRVDRIVRGKVDGARLMSDRMRLERDFLASGTAAGGVVFLDSDVAINRSPEEIFDGSFDVALTWRGNPPDAPFNGGVALYRTGPAAIRFYDHLIETHAALEQYPAVIARFPEGMARWWGHQLAMAATVGWNEFARRRSDRLAIDGAAVRFLSSDDYNFAMDPALPTPPGLDRRFFIHFKGSRKAGLARYAETVLGSPPAADRHPAAVAGPIAKRPAPREVHFCFGNHSSLGHKTLADLFRFLEAGFIEHGFKVTTCRENFRSDVPNIILENRNGVFKPFLDRNAGKLKVICVVTEILKADRFDDAQGGWNGAARFQHFLSIANHYAGFLTTVPSNVNLLRTIAPTTFFEFGYSDRLLSSSDWQAWAHDYSWSGAMTPHRRKFLGDVTARIDVKTPGDARMHTAELLSVDDYVDLVRHTAINICLKRHPAWEYPSGARLARILHAGVGGAVETTSAEIRLSRYFPKFSDSGEFLRRFAAVDRKRIAAEAQERLSLYRAELPMKREVERNIAECPSLIA
jgi:Tfp pilus assembly protein PilF